MVLNTSKVSKGLSLHATETRISSGLTGHLARMLACVASVPLRLRSNEIPRNRNLWCFARAKSGARAVSFFGLSPQFSHKTCASDKTTTSKILLFGLYFLPNPTETLATQASHMQTSCTQYIREVISLKLENIFSHFYCIISRFSHKIFTCQSVNCVIVFPWQSDA